MTQPAPAAVRSFFISGPAGQLEALLNTGADDAAYATLVCHPHPLFGGTMHNKVVFNAMKALNGFGLPVVRFNFRGTGLSAGRHDNGRGEIDDVGAALAWLESEFGLPVVFAGFSFGAGVGLRAAAADPRVAAMIAIGAPAQVENRRYDYAFLSGATVPKLFVSGDRDEFAAPEQLRAVVAALPEPKQLILVKDADHFFEPGHLPELRRTIEEWTSRFLAITG
jgi:alpha/beta superfamily hydrolase